MNLNSNEFHYLEISNIKFKLTLNNEIILTNDLKKQLFDKYTIQFNDDNTLNNDEFEKIKKYKMCCREGFELIYLLSQFTTSYQNRCKILLKFMNFISLICKGFNPNLWNNYLFPIWISQNDNIKNSQIFGFYGDCMLNCYTFMVYNTLRYVYKYHNEMTFMKLLNSLNINENIINYFNYSGNHVIDIQNIIDYLSGNEYKTNILSLESSNLESQMLNLITIKQQITEQLLKDKMYLIMNKSTNSSIFIKHLLSFEFKFHYYSPVDGRDLVLMQYASDVDHRVLYIKLFNSINEKYPDEILYDLNTCSIIPVYSKLKIGYIVILNLYPSEFDEIYSFILNNNEILKLFSNPSKIMQLIIKVCSKFNHTINDLIQNNLIPSKLIDYINIELKINPSFGNNSVVYCIDISH